MRAHLLVGAIVMIGCHGCHDGNKSSPPRPRTAPHLPKTAAGKAAVKVVGDARGVVVAGAYLRDQGVVRGQGPGLEDVLDILSDLDALPTVDNLPRTAFVHTRDAKLADETATMGFDGEKAYVILIYFQPGAPHTTPDPDPSHNHKGSIGLTDTTTHVRPGARMTLTIPASGDSTWTREDLNFATPN
jgi:hypothetical protein